MSPDRRICGQINLDPDWRQVPYKKGPLTSASWKTTILSFRVEEKDPQRKEPAQVRAYDFELKGTRIYGFLRAGDEVEVFADEDDDQLRPIAIHNVKTHAWVTAEDDDPPETDPAAIPDLAIEATVVGDPEFRMESSHRGELTVLMLRASWPNAMRDVELRPKGLTKTNIRGKVHKGDHITFEGDEWRNNVLQVKRIRVRETGETVEPD